MFWDSRDISKMAPFTGLFPGNAVQGNHVREVAYREKCPAVDYERQVGQDPRTFGWGIHRDL